MSHMHKASPTTPHYPPQPTPLLSNMHAYSPCLPLQIIYLSLLPVRLHFGLEPTPGAAHASGSCSCLLLLPSLRCSAGGEACCPHPSTFCSATATKPSLNAVARFPTRSLLCLTAVGGPRCLSPASSPSCCWVRATAGCPPAKRAYDCCSCQGCSFARPSCRPHTRWATPMRGEAHRAVRAPRPARRGRARSACIPTVEAR